MLDITWIDIVIGRFLSQRRVASLITLLDSPTDLHVHIIIVISIIDIVSRRFVILRGRQLILEHFKYHFGVNLFVFVFKRAKFAYFKRIAK